MLDEEGRGRFKQAMIRIKKDPKADIELFAIDVRLMRLKHG